MLRQEMTSRERMEAVLEKKTLDHLPFWPKITDTYIKFQEKKWRDKNIAEIHEWIGSDYLSYSQLNISKSYPSGTEVRTLKNGNEFITFYEIDGYKLREVTCITDQTGDGHPTEFPIKTKDDISAMIKFYNSQKAFVTKEAVEKHNESVDRNPDKLFMYPLTPSPLMKLIQEKMGLENFVYMLCDHTELMNELIDSMYRADCAITYIACEHSPHTYFLSTENTSTTLISPQLFEEYCLEHLCGYNNIMARYGKKQILHMCGKLKNILEMIDKIPAVAMEAFTSPTVGDTAIKDGFDKLPNKTIIGGSCATTWLLPAEDITDRILSDIREAGGVDNLFLSSGGVIPFSASPEIIKEVWDGIKDKL